jgi:c-di-GMP-binding flagellar brake protein YcgR
MALDNQPSGAEQRRHYRVTAGLDAMLTVALQLPDGRTIPAELVDLSADGACLRWPLATMPVLDLNDTVQLLFQAKTGTVPLEILAAVRWMGPDTGFVKYGFEFQDVGDLAAAGDARLWALFNRRRHLRE